MKPFILTWLAIGIVLIVLWVLTTAVVWLLLFIFLWLPMLAALGYIWKPKRAK